LPIGSGVTLYSSLDRWPEPLTAYFAGKLANRAGLRLELGGLAPRDSYFSASDFLISGWPTRRPIGVGRSGDRWFVWYEHGGFGLHVRLCATTADIPSGRAAAVIGEEW
jgi:hypothetical protein